MFAKEMAIDLGTANTLVFVKNKGIVVNEPSVVAVNSQNHQVLSVGDEAKQMIGRTPGSIIAIRPMKDGVIADFETTQTMLRYFIKKAMKQSFFSSKPKIVICVPSGVTEVEKRAVIGAALAAGSRTAFLIEEPMAAAIGARLPVEEPVGSMVVDIGGGTSEVAVISFGGIVTSKSLRVAGDEIESHIISYVKREFNLAIGERTAEEIKINIGTAYPTTDQMAMEVRGRDMVTGLPKTITVTTEHALAAMKEPIDTIVEAIKETLENTPPELAADILETGIMLTGGGALIRGLDERIAEETGMPVRTAEDPLSCVVVGTGQVLEHLDTLKNVLISSKGLRS